MALPILTTERLTLRQLSSDDTQDILALRSDPEINKYLDRPISKTAEDAIGFINKVNDNIQKNVSLYWAITMTDAKTFVGTICLFDFSNDKNSCEIGYELLTKYQGQGIMKESVQRIIDYVFQTLNLKKIIACPHYENKNSIKLLEKLDFVNSSETDKESPSLLIFTLTHRN